MERPSFGVTCPEDIKRYADWAKNYTTVTWSPVVAVDNSGVVPNVAEYGMPIANRFYQGRHEVIFNASDEAGNYRICQFHVTIEGKLKLVQLRYSIHPRPVKIGNYLVLTRHKLYLADERGYLELTGFKKERLFFFGRVSL